MALPGFFKGTEMPTAGWWEALWPDPARVLAQVGITAGMDVIDLCSGDGWFTLQIGKIARHVTAIDIDRQFLDVARVRLADGGIANCEFVEGNAYDIDKLVSRPADSVFMAMHFMACPSDPPGARGGRCTGAARSFRDRELACATARKNDDSGRTARPASELRMTAEATIAAVEPGGFELHWVVELPPYHYGAIFNKH